MQTKILISFMSTPFKKNPGSMQAPSFLDHFFPVCHNFGQCIGIEHVFSREFFKYFWLAAPHK